MERRTQIAEHGTRDLDLGPAAFARRALAAEARAERAEAERDEARVAANTNADQYRIAFDRVQALESSERALRETLAEVVRRIDHPRRFHDR